MSNKIEYDKYYTPVDLAGRLIGKTYELIGEENISEVVEPSAGAGSFSDRIDCCRAYDLMPEGENIEKADFLKLDLGYKKGRLFIGNPPFGDRSKLVVDFYNKCCDEGDFIAFVLPVGFLDNDSRLYRFDLIYSEDLGVCSYSGRDLHCCFNVYRRPEGGVFNDRPDYRLKEIEIVEHRRKNGDYQTGKNREVKPGYCYGMCNWGNGSLGKVPDYVGQYAQEVYIYCDDERIRKEIADVLEFGRIREFAKSVSMKKISVMKLYKYLYENIDGLTLRKEEEKGLW